MAGLYRWTDGQGVVTEGACGSSWTVQMDTGQGRWLCTHEPLLLGDMHHLPKAWSWQLVKAEAGWGVLTPCKF